MSTSIIFFNGKLSRKIRTIVQYIKTKTHKFQNTNSKTYVVLLIAL